MAWQRKMNYLINNKMIGIYLSLLVIIIVIIIHITIHVLHWEETKKIRSNVKSLMTLTQSMVDKKFSLLDNAEFSSLDPYMKDAYKKYIVDLAMPKILAKVNTAAKDAQLQSNIKDNDALIKSTIASVVDGLDFSSLVSEASSKVTQS